MHYKGCKIVHKGTEEYAYRYAKNKLKENPNLVYLEVPESRDDWKEKLHEYVGNLRRGKENISGRGGKPNLARG